MGTKESIKSCFLYCSLYPVDIPIDDLINCWLAEGILGEHDTYEEAYNRGITTIRSLVDACLLETHEMDFVKMHDVVRDVAKWIANTFGDDHTSVFQAGIGLTEISHIKVSASAKRISFVSNKIQCLPDCFTECPDTTSLLLQDNEPLVKIPHEFFLSFPALRVVNLSATGIRALPCSINSLCQLRALILQNCNALELPPIGNLCNLQLLDCDNTRLRCLPQRMDKLTNLRLLNMPESDLESSIDQGFFLKLSSIEIINMMGSCLGSTSFDEISLDNSSIFNRDHTWMTRLKRFRIEVGKTSIYVPFNKSRREIIVSKCGTFSSRVVSGMLQFASHLYLEEFMGLRKLFAYNSFDGLKSLHIESCSCDFGSAEEGSGHQIDPLPNLEHLSLVYVDNLKSVSDFGHLRFSKLRRLDINICDSLTCLFNVGGGFAVPLEEITISYCEELLKSNSRVRKLVLRYLPKLGTLGEPWEHLEELKVISCNEIRKLPLSIQTSDNIKVIRGTPEWWSQLEWDDNNFKSNLEHCFTESYCVIIGVWGAGGIGKTTLVKNLNNELKHIDVSIRSKLSFGVVIWITVPKPPIDIRKVQAQIANRLNVKVDTEGSQESNASKIYQWLKQEKSFLVILDDVWEAIDLDYVGVPQPKDHAGSKVIITSRFLDVCNQMKIDTEMKVYTLDENESWALFIKNVGDVANWKDIEPLAMEIARECDGLPLAITVIGASLRGKNMAEQWEDALESLRKSEPNATYVRDKVYQVIKWSVDSLEQRGNRSSDIQSCFLYCSLFPASIPTDLIHCWWAEGFLGEHDTYEKAYNRGITIIEELKNVCLLEESHGMNCVKMHDVVRDVGKWIANTFGDEHSSVIQAGIELIKISNVKVVSTLLLQDKYSLVKIPDKFFLSFPALRVLNLSRTGIRALPSSVNNLSQLRALILGYCYELKELPAIGNLCNLQLLDCDHTKLCCLPEGMDKLTNLRLLNMPLGELKESIDLGVFHELQRLEMLHLPIRCGDVVGATSFDEISHLPNLTSLFIYLDSSSISIFKSDHTWMKRLKTFQITVGNTSNHPEVPFNKSTRAICLLGFDIFNNKVSLSSMLQFASHLYLERGMGLMEFIRNNSFDGLKSLYIKHCSCDFGPSIEGSGQFDDPLPNLEILSFYSVDHLKSVSDFGHFLGLRFSKLHKLDILHCDNLTCLFNAGGAFSVPRHLEEISLFDGNHLTELLAQFGSSQMTLVSSEIPRVRKLRLDYLDALGMFGEPESMWEHLEELIVIGCNGIRKLPLSIQTSNNIKLITGSSEWWSQLEWDDHNFKSNLEHRFTAIQKYGCQRAGSYEQCKHLEKNQSFRLVPDQFYSSYLEKSHFLSLFAQTMFENGTAANIPVSKNVSATVENNSTVSTKDLQHSTSIGSCSLAFTGISYSFNTNVSDKLSPTWVVDSGATEHMTNIPLGKSLILKDVLHISKLFANLISIQKLTKDSKCQEKNTKEMIGRASEKGGLYCLDFHSGEYISKNSLSSSFLSKSIISNKEKVWLYHCRCAKFLHESPFLRSPKSLNPNEPIESPNPNIDNGILENNLPLHVYSRRKRQTDQTSQLQSSPQVTTPNTHHEPVEPSETANQTDHEEEFNQPNDLDLPIALGKGTRSCT
ncbi:hypothetical protein H5410_064824 [Solanum commersonii]|uniref:NB-ARC domain-containing protein n=1 Tax=Solanum commersonii TaxID=4109 RepID=A0A9J5VYM1_SOLCO|nr:hypothetical protein H5410_064824 [Solanum commersonii]